jgi:hypothetical protein
VAFRFKAGSSFSEEKEAKRLWLMGARGRNSRRKMEKSSLVLSFKKE